MTLVFDDVKVLPFAALCAHAAQHHTLGAEVATVVAPATIKVKGDTIHDARSVVSMITRRRNGGAVSTRARFNGHWPRSNVLVVSI